VSALVGPFLTGVYAGDEEALGAEAVFGTLVELERRYRSLALGGLVAALGRRRRGGLRGSWSVAEGLGPFARRLAQRLAEPPVLGARVRELQRAEKGWEIRMATAGGESELRAARLVLAVPAYEAARLLAGVDADAAALLAGIEYAPIAALPLGVEAAKLRRPLEGFGFLVPRSEDHALLGCLFMSRVFPGRAPKGHELLHCMLGGVRRPELVDEPDDRLVELARRDLEQLLGLAADPQSLGVARWPRAIPQPGRDHVRRVAEVERRLAEQPGLALAGAWQGGVAVADAFASGLRAGERV
jgi:oxygen-dependent protoporphyrinogen oxidase